MRAVFRGGMAVLAAAVLSACVALSPGARKAADANPVTGGPIEVTELPPAPAIVEAGKPSATPPAAAPASPAGATAPPSRPAEAAAPPAAEAPAPPLAAPEAPKSPAHIACEKKGGTWAGSGTSGTYACVSPTRDGGKRCTAGTQCEGVCLARSGTCAPFKPLFGCNEILQDDGRRVTLCLD